MDLATMVAIMTCTGHCKRVVAPMDLIGFPTITQCREYVSKAENQRYVIRMKNGSDIRVYQRCVAAPPHAIPGNRVFRSRWWHGHLTGSG